MTDARFRPDYGFPRVACIMDTDRNFLLGVLALQADLLDNNRFASE